MSSLAAWLISAVVVSMAIAASVMLEKKFGRLSQPSGWLSGLGFYGTLVCVVYFGASYGLSVLHVQGSGEYALIGAIAGIGEVLAQVVFGRRRR